METQISRFKSQFNDEKILEMNDNEICENILKIYDENK